MRTTPAIPARYAGIDQPDGVLGELAFGARDQIGYLDDDRRAHVVRVERSGSSYAIVDHCDGRAIVVQVLDAFDNRPAADAVALDWAIQARLHATGRRETNPRPREAHEQSSPAAPQGKRAVRVSERQQTLAA